MGKHVLRRPMPHSVSFEEANATLNDASVEQTEGIATNSRFKKKHAHNT